MILASRPQQLSGGTVELPLADGSGGKLSVSEQTVEMVEIGTHTERMLFARHLQ